MTQKKIKELADGICLFTSYLYLALEKEPNVSETLSYLSISLKNGWVEEDGTVLNPNKIIEYVIGKKVSVVKSLFNPKKTCIAKFHFNYDHFVVVDKNDNVLFDPLGQSNTVKYGRIVDYRIVDSK